MELDKFLQLIPDTPILDKYVSGLCDKLSARPTNALADWTPALGLNGRRQYVETSNLNNFVIDSVSDEISVHCI